MQTLTPSARALLELDRQEVERQISLTLHQRVEYDGQAVVCRAEAAALAAEGKHQQAQGWMAGAIRYRSRVIALDVELSGLRARRDALMARLNGVEPEAAPVVLGREQVAAMDETAGAHA